jgi:dGTPase
MRLDSPYCAHPGLNLSWEVLEGLAKHNGPVKRPGWVLHALNEAFPLDLARQPSLEAQVAALADDIAYDNHDIDDGLRAGILDLDQLLALDFVAEQWRAVEARFHGAEREALVRELVRGQIGLMVNDALEETRRRLAGVGSLEEIRAAPQPFAALSEGMAGQERALKRFMYANLYHHPRQKQTAERARSVIAKLFAAYHQDTSLLPPAWLAALPTGEPARSRYIADFIAGMTDHYAIARYREIFGKAPRGLIQV